MLGTDVVGNATLTFRPARAVDASSLYALSRPHVASGALVERSLHAFREDIGGFFVAEWDGSIVACAGTRVVGDAAMEIFNFCVSQAWRGHGCGSWMLEHLLDRLRLGGCHEVFLFSRTAYRWFGLFGFQSISLAEVPNRGLRRTPPRENSVPMRLTLDKLTATISRVDSLLADANSGPYSNLVGAQHLRGHGPVFSSDFS